MSEEKNHSHRLMDAFFRLGKLHIGRPSDGLRPPELGLLKRLVRSGSPDGLKVSELSQQLQVTPPMITQVVKALEARGLVTRSVDVEDRRAVRVSITDAGRGAWEQATASMLAAFDGLVKHLGPTKSAQLADLLIEVHDLVRLSRAAKGPDLASDTQSDDPNSSTSSPTNKQVETPQELAGLH